VKTRTRSNAPRNNHPPRVSSVGWRGVWWAAQITPILFSSYVWLIIAGLAPPLAAVLVAGSVVLVAARNSRPGLWWRFGAREMLGSERDQVLAAIVPIGSLRGRRQPARVWEGRRMHGGFVAMPTEHDLVVSSLIKIWVANRSFNDEQISAFVAHGVGQQEVGTSRMVAAVDAFTLPWHLLAVVAEPAMAALRRIPLVPFAWCAG